MWGPYLPRRGGVVQICLCCVINGFEKKTRACWLSPNTSEGFRNPSYVSFRRFFLCFFFSFCIAAVLQCRSLFAAFIVFGQRVGWQYLPQARASPLIRDPHLHLQLPAPAGATPSLLQAGGFLGRINGLLGPATGVLGSELHSENPKGGRGAGVPWVGGCGHGEKGQRGAHTGLLRPKCSLPLPLLPHITLGKSLNFPLVCILIHQLGAGINLSPVASFP